MVGHMTPPQGLTECPNRQSGHSRWICLCARPGANQREHLSKLRNGWLSADRLRDNARLASDPQATEEDIQKRIRDCEKDASYAYGYWEMSQ